MKLRYFGIVLLLNLVLLSPSAWAVKAKPIVLDPDALMWLDASNVKISLLDAIRLASQAVSGVPVRAFLMRSQRRLIYKVVLVDKPSRTWTALSVDALRGKVFGIKTYRLGRKTPRVKAKNSSKP